LPYRSDDLIAAGMARRGAVVAMLTGRPFETADPAVVVMPDHNGTAPCLFSRFCNGLLVGFALELDLLGGSGFVITKEKAI